MVYMNINKPLTQEVAMRQVMGYGPGCGERIEVSVPTRYSCKIIEVQCGSTSPSGYPWLCEKCEKANEG